MNAGNPQDPAPNARLDQTDLESDPLFRLLAQSPRPEPDAWFAARTLARCRHEGMSGDERTNARVLVRVWRWALGGGLAAAMAVALMVNSQPQPAATEAQSNVQDAFEIVASLDSDLDSSSSSSWQDSSL
jgi:hypothetical protein